MSIVDGFFDLVVGSKHTHVHGNSSANGWNAAFPESEDSFFFDDSGNSITDILVVSALIRREKGITLATDKCQISRVTNKASNKTRETGEDSLPS